jgi:hypothetical protein
MHFSAQRTNDFALGAGAASNHLVQMNRIRFIAAVGAVGWPVLKLKQVHSGIVRVMENTSAAGKRLKVMRQSLLSRAFYSPFRPRTVSQFFLLICRRERCCDPRRLAVRRIS